jgi:hypothetical protein
LRALEDFVHEPIEIDDISFFVRLQWLPEFLDDLIQLLKAKTFEIAFGFVVLVEIRIEGKSSGGTQRI